MIAPIRKASARTFTGRSTIAIVQLATIRTAATQKTIKKPLFGIPKSLRICNVVKKPAGASATPSPVAICVTRMRPADRGAIAIWPIAVVPGAVMKVSPCLKGSACVFSEDLRNEVTILAERVRASPPLKGDWGRRGGVRSEGLVACQPRPFRITTDGDDTANLPDLVQRKFTADRPGVKFVGDITYMHTWQGFIYLATVIDCYSKRVGALPIFRLTARSPTSLSPAIRLRQQHERGFDLAWSSLGYHAARDSQG